MNKAIQKGKEIIREILSHKIRMVVGIVSFLALFVLSIYFLYEGEINKRMMISTFLCLVVGFFIICPRLRDWRISLVTTACYLSVVPGKMFDRIELPVHDLSNLREGAELANILIILLIFAVLLLIFQRSGLALSVGGVSASGTMYCQLFCGSLQKQLLKPQRYYGGRNCRHCDSKL